MWLERNPSSWSLDKKPVHFLLECLSFFLPISIFQGLTVYPLSIVADSNLVPWWLTLLFCREEDEYSELRSELSQSQQEVNEDSRSMDQDQTSVSIPENQSTMVTADMGESSQASCQAGFWLLGCTKNLRNTWQPEFKFNYSRNLVSRWKHICFNLLFTTLLATMN